MGYYLPSPIDYSNGGWEYYQENTNSEHSTQWRYASKPQDEQENHMGYLPPPQNDSSHYSNGGWEYHQEMIDDEAIHTRYDPKPPNDSCHFSHGVCAYQQECEQSSERNFLPEPQSKSSKSYCCDANTNYGWEGNSGAPYDTQQETSSLDYASTHSFLQDLYNSSHQPHNSFHN
ncbi:hypothetical protein AHAS_Ahas11G0130500 [Arachis hypogaea]